LARSDVVPEKYARIEGVFYVVRREEADEETVQPRADYRHPEAAQNSRKQRVIQSTLMEILPVKLPFLWRYFSMAITFCLLSTACNQTKAVTAAVAPRRSHAPCMFRPQAMTRDGSLAKPFKTINAAAQRAKAGDTVECARELTAKQ
jgi:hypothetical protein